MKKFKKWLRDFYFKSLPLLHFDICLPFIEITTSISMYNFQLDIYEYSKFRIKIFKWKFEIGVLESRWHRIQRKQQSAGT